MEKSIKPRDQSELYAQGSHNFVVDWQFVNYS